MPQINEYGGQSIASIGQPVVQTQAMQPYGDTTREQQFQQWYAQQAAAVGIDSNPDDPAHQYDYRKAWEAGAGPDPASKHWPSKFKLAGHPNRIVDGTDTITGQPEVVVNEYGGQSIASMPKPKTYPKSPLLDSPPPGWSAEDLYHPPRTNKTEQAIASIAGSATGALAAAGERSAQEVTSPSGHLQQIAAGVPAPTQITLPSAKVTDVDLRQEGPLGLGFNEARKRAMNVPPPDPESYGQNLAGYAGIIPDLWMYGGAAAATPGPAPLKTATSLASVEAARMLAGEGSPEQVVKMFGFGALLGSLHYLPHNIKGAVLRWLGAGTLLSGGRAFESGELPTAGQAGADYTFASLAALEALRPSTLQKLPHAIERRLASQQHHTEPQPRIKPEPEIDFAHSRLGLGETTIDGKPVGSVVGKGAIVPPRAEAPLTSRVGTKAPAKPVELEPSHAEPYPLSRGKTVVPPGIPRVPRMAEEVPAVPDAYPLTRGPAAKIPSGEPAVLPLAAKSTEPYPLSRGGKTAVGEGPVKGEYGGLFDVAEKEAPAADAQIPRKSIPLEQELPLAPKQPTPEPPPAGPTMGELMQRGRRFGLEPKRGENPGAFQARVEQAEAARAKEPRPDVQAEMITEDAGRGETFRATRREAEPPSERQALGRGIEEIEAEGKPVEKGVLEGKDQPKARPAEAAAESAPQTYPPLADIKKMKMPELKERLRDAGMPDGGAKGALIERLNRQYRARESDAARGRKEPPKGGIFTEEGSAYGGSPINAMIDVVRELRRKVKRGDKGSPHVGFRAFTQNTNRTDNSLSYNIIHEYKTGLRKGQPASEIIDKVRSYLEDDSLYTVAQYDPKAPEITRSDVPVANAIVKAIEAVEGVGDIRSTEAPTKPFSDVSPLYRQAFGFSSPKDLQANIAKPDLRQLTAGVERKYKPKSDEGGIFEESGALYIPSLSEIADIIRKAKNYAIPIKSTHGDNFLVYKNPTTSDYRAIAAEFRDAYPKAPKGEGKVRTAYDSKGNRYEWMSGRGVHDDIAPILDKVADGRIMGGSRKDIPKGGVFEESGGAFLGPEMWKDLARSVGKGARRAGEFAKRIGEHEFLARGDLPPTAYKLSQEKRNKVRESETKALFSLRDYNETVRKEFGARSDKLAKSDNDILGEALKGDQTALAKLPPETKIATTILRDSIDNLSTHLIEIGAIREPLVPTVIANKGVYMHRAYKAWDVKRWDKFVKKHHPEVVADARAYLQRTYRDMFDRESVSTLEREQRVDGMLDELLRVGEKTSGPLDFFVREGARKDISILMKRGDYAREIRRLWGEYTEPDATYAKTWAAMSDLAATHEFFLDLKKAGLEEGWLKKHQTKEGKRSFSEKIAEVDDPTMWPLSHEGKPLYAELHVAQAIRGVFENRPTGLGWRSYVAINAAHKYTATVGNQMTHLRNVGGNFFIIGAQGYISPLHPGRMAKNSAKVASAFGSRYSKTFNSPEGRALYQDARRYGIVGEAVRSLEMESMIKEAMGSGQQLMFMNRFMEATAKRAKKGVKGLAEIYRGEDDVFRLFSWLMERERYSKAYPELSQEQIKAKTAEIIRDVMPTYSKVPRITERVRNFPFTGPFVSFYSEMFRNVYKTFELGVKEMKKGSKEKNASLFSIGATRISAMVGMAVGVKALVNQFRKRSGVTQDQEDKLRKTLPSWSKDGDILWLGERVSGEWDYIDLSYTNPHSAVTDTYNAWNRGDDWKHKLWLSLGASFEPFLNEELFFSKIRELDKNAPENRVYNPQDTPENITKDIVKHFADGVTPGTAKNLERIYRAAVDRGNRSGHVPNLRNEILASMTGVRISTINMNTTLYYRALDYKEKQRDSNQLYLKPAKQKGPIAEEEIKASRDAMEASRYDSFEGLYETIEAMAGLGTPKKVVLDQLKDAGVSDIEIKRLMAGIYTPYTPSADTARTIKLRERYRKERWGHLPEYKEAE